MARVGAVSQESTHILRRDLPPLIVVRDHPDIVSIVDDRPSPSHRPHGENCGHTDDHNSVHFSYLFVFLNTTFKRLSELLDKILAFSDREIMLNHCTKINIFFF